MASIVLCSLSAALEVGATPATAPGAEHVEALVSGLEAHAHSMLDELSDRLETHPDDAQAALARCGLLEAAQELLDATWDLWTPVQVDLDRFARDEEWCSEDLVTRFPADPSVRVYELELSWGEDAIAKAQRTLADDSVAWTDATKARFHELLAWRYWGQEYLEEAVDSAREAARLDQTLDMTLLLAEGLVLDGNEAEAITVLASRLAESTEPHDIYGKALRLVELDACEMALPVLERAEMKGYTLFHAEVLECLGETEAARAKYEEAFSAGWKKDEILLRLFKMDLTAGNRESAHRSYQALRDLGWHADPLSRHRLSLMVAHPGGPWRLRDLLGLLALAGLALGVVLVPALWVLPVHYVGLLRRVRGGHQLGGSRWRLRHVWIASTGLIGAEVLASYLFLEGEIELWVTSQLLTPQHSAEALAHFGVFAFALTFVVIACLIRKPDLSALTRVDWPAKRVLAIAAILVFAFVVLNRINVNFAVLVGFDDFLGPGAAAAEMSRVTLFGSILETYGPGVFFVFIVVLVPVLEEVLFRWIVLDGVARHIPFGWANALQAAIFAVLHESVALLPFFFVFGVVLGLVRKKAGGILPGILVHAGYNGVIILPVVLVSMG